MTWAAIFATLLSAALLLLLGMALLKKLLPARCPRCSKRALRVVTAVPAPGANGKCYLSYHLCTDCGAKLRLKDGAWSDPPEDEWTRMNPR